MEHEQAKRKIIIAIQTIIKASKEIATTQKECEGHIPFVARKLHNLLLLIEDKQITTQNQESLQKSINSILRKHLDEEYGLKAKVFRGHKVAVGL